MTRNSVHAWIVAWEAAMAERGFPRARLDLDWDGTVFFYVWTHDVDEYASGALDVSTEGPPEDAWDHAHAAFIAVDSLRPVYIVRSEALRWMMDGMN